MSRSPQHPIAVRPARPQDWPAIETLFGEKGACGGCWCMLWRAPYGGKRFQQDKGARNRESLRRLIASGETRACLAFSGKDAIGWLSLGPRESFAYFARSRSFRSLDGENTWSITCLYVDSRWRAQGVSIELVKGAIDYARHARARTLEAYPIAAGHARMPAAFAWTGLPQIFERTGFHRADVAAGSRPVYRLDLSAD